MAVSRPWEGSRVRLRTTASGEFSLMSLPARAPSSASTSTFHPSERILLACSSASAAFQWTREESAFHAAMPSLDV